MGELLLVEVPLPLQVGPASVPAEWIAGWLQESHGGRRPHALAELLEHLTVFGVRGCALVGGSWLAVDPVRPGVERDGPWGSTELWAERAGVFAPDWLRRVALAVLAQLPEPGMAPRALMVADATGEGLVVDPSLAGRRPGFVVLSLDPSMADVAARVGSPTVAWLAVAAAGLLRGDRYRTTGERLAGLLVPHAAVAEADRPVNPQEVVARAGETVRRLVDRGRAAFDVATLGVFLPDPDDEYVYCLAASGSEVYAYDAGVVGEKPPVASVGFGLTATVAMGAAVDPKGGRVAVRVLEHRDEVVARYRDLGFSAPDTGFESEQFVDRDRLDAARKGPWVMTAEQLPATLSPTRRNLVVRFQGHLVDPAWSTEEERRAVSADRKRWMATFALRVSSEVVTLLSEGLAHWRDGLRDEMMRELARSADLDAIAQRLAHWLSARSVALFRLEGNALALSGWSHAGPRPDLSFDLSRQPGQELRLLRAPLYPRRSTLDADGFLGDPDMLRALGGVSENVGTVPIGEAPWGVLRVDGAMSLFGGHLGRRSRQRGLVHHRPTVTPQHVRGALDDVARVLALALEGRAHDARHASWHELLTRTRAGLATREEAEAAVRALRSAARSRGAAAALVGLHRNTFRRQLDELAERFGPLW
jgi:hypothetical protein